MKLPIIALTGLFVLAVAGCSSGSSGYSASSEASGSSAGSALPPPDPMVAPPVSESGPATSEATGAVAETSVVVESSPSEPVVATGSVISIPEAGGWTNPSIPLSQHQTDIDSCFRYASAQIDRDTLIDYDRQQVRDVDNQVQGMAALSRRVDYYTAKRRRGSLFDSCMTSKGYTKT
jgi:hypothetical protein